MITLQFIIWYTLVGVIIVLIFWRNLQIFRLLFSKEEKAVYLWSFDRDLGLMAQHLRLSHGARMIDLGCGDGKALRFFAREYGIHGKGYDINRFAITYGRLINRWRHHKHISLIAWDFAQADLSQADYIYVYLFPQQMANIEDWVFASIDPDTIIISNTFQFKRHKPFEVILDHKGKERIGLYRK